MNGWTWFENSRKAVNTSIQSVFELDKEGFLWFRDKNGYAVKIEDLEDISNFLINVAKIYE